MKILDWFRRPQAIAAEKPSGTPEGVSVHKLRAPDFVGQQVGDAADLLHAEFRKALTIFPQVQRAYFCKLRYPATEQIGAAVCVASNTGEDIEVVEALAAVVRDNLGSGSHIDILFLSSHTEVRLALVCQPFYKVA